MSALNTLLVHKLLHFVQLTSKLCAEFTSFRPHIPATADAARQRLTLEGQNVSGDS